MKKEHMEYFYYEVRYISWEEIQECMIKPTDNLDECKRKVGRVTCCFDSHLDKAWNYFNNFITNSSRIYSEIKGRIA